MVGMMAMDLTLVEVDQIPGISSDDEVVLFGQQGKEHNSICDVASALGTSPAALTCSLSRRLERKYIDVSP